MAKILPFEQPGSPSQLKASIATSLLNLADAYGLYSGLYLHFGHAKGSAVRAIASTPIAQRKYVDLIASSSLVIKALVAHRPFSWSSSELRFASDLESDPVGIAVPVQDYSNGPGLVALVGVDIYAARKVVKEHGPSLSWAATDIHVAALDLLRDARPEAPTRREMECLRMAAEGMTVPMMAEMLDISTRTVEVYLHRIVNKLGGTNKVNAVAIAVSQGLLRCDPSGYGQVEPAS
jgi:DNA-binding CsgD family transcriptional regulator